jgi:hypothetical protein
VVALKFIQQFDLWKRFEQQHSGAKQAAEKLNFSEGVKNGSRQDAQERSARLE